VFQLRNGIISIIIGIILMERLLEALKQYWGYDSFLPLQKEAMECVINNKDSVVIFWNKKM
jgi:superfamily II DNA helicase RecQ